MNITGLKIPTAGRQTSWLLTNMTEELNWGPPRNNSSLVVRAGLEPATSGFQVRHPNHSAMLSSSTDRKTPKKAVKVMTDIAPENKKYEAELSFGNVYHTLLIDFHHAAERQNYQNSCIGVCTLLCETKHYIY